MKDNVKNDTQEDWCSEEIAQALKDKGFDCLCHRYIHNGTTHISYGRNSQAYRLYIPTHAIAIKWIHENFNLYIQTPFYESYCWVVINTLEPEEKNIWLSGLDTDTVGFPTPYLATENALLYTLQVLIN